MLKKKLWLASLCALGGVLSISPANAQKVSDDKVRIGVLSDLSGLYADTAGKGSVEAARMAIEDFGGKVLGKPIELVAGDHQNKADVGASQVRIWYDRDGVDAVFDVNNSSVAVAVGNLARERTVDTIISKRQRGERIGRAHGWHHVRQIHFCRQACHIIGLVNIMDLLT